MKTVLVTGSSGFTGHYLVRHLKSLGHRVTGLARKPDKEELSYTCDIQDPHQLLSIVETIKPDWVIHLAASTFVAHSRNEDFYGINVLGTLNLLDALASLKDLPSKVIIAGSANIYGNADFGRITEDTCPSPVNHYACSKLAMEHMVATRFDQLPILITRSFNYTGPGQEKRFLVPKIINHFARRKSKIELGNINVSRDFSDVRDIAKFYVKLLESKAHSTRINLCSGKATSLGELIKTISSIAGYDIEIKTNLEFTRRNEISKLVGDPSLLDSIIGDFPRTPLEDTLSDMYESAKNNA